MTEIAVTVKVTPTVEEVVLTLSYEDALHVLGATGRVTSPVNRNVYSKLFDALETAGVPAKDLFQIGSGYTFSDR